MESNKQYTTHLCTFMGREANLKILIPYVDKALEIGAVDNYWFIDMTRKRSDHELIKKLSNELNDKYPGRVHLYNSEERGRIIDDKDKLAEATKSWETFYKFLRRFNDNDIIAKCDDDTYYIDVETLKAAYEFRWNNKKPYLMHANAINNGVAAYHMKKHGALKNNELDLYPTGGLAGPLFCHAEVACENHKQFTNDMINNPENLNKYKLGKNIQFCNRVSINFIFMLGKDRHELSKITYQDEYDTSCKYAQRENRPNVIIGDFIMAHHTYGVQEPVMEKLQTHVGYEKLCDKLNNQDVKFEHKSICTELNATTTISQGGRMLMKSWVSDKSHVIQDPETKKYICLEHIQDPNMPRPQMKTIFGRTDDIKSACIFEIDVNGRDNIYLQNNTFLLRTPRGEHLTEQAVPNARFFQASYKNCNVTVSKQPSGNYIIRPVNRQDYCLSTGFPHPNMWDKDPINAKKISNFVLFSSKEGEQKEWNLIPLKKYNDIVIAGTIKRPGNFYKYANDETTATCQYIEDLPDNSISREWIWMVKDYIWEMIPVHNKENIYRVKLVADDKPDMYLFYLEGQDKLITGGGGDEFEFVDKAPKYLKNVKTGKYVNITDAGQVVLQDDFAELAMCPQR